MHLIDFFFPLLYHMLQKDDTALSALNLKDGHVFMMMGTAGELPKAPEVPVKFMEDMTETQLAKAVRSSY